MTKRSQPDQDTSNATYYSVQPPMPKKSKLSKNAFKTTPKSGQPPYGFNTSNIKSHGQWHDQNVNQSSNLPPAIQQQQPLSITKIINPSEILDRFEKIKQQQYANDKSISMIHQTLDNAIAAIEQLTKENQRLIQENQQQRKENSDLRQNQKLSTKNIQLLESEVKRLRGELKKAKDEKKSAHQLTLNNAHTNNYHKQSETFTSPPLHNSKETHSYTPSLFQQETDYSSHNNHKDVTNLHHNHHYNQY
jgi:hypothetical protein